MTPTDKMMGSHLQALPGGAETSTPNVVDFTQVRSASLLRKGLEAAAKGRVDEAIASFRQSVEAQPTAEAFTYWAWMTSFLGDLDGAIELCKTAIAVDPDFGNPYNDIGTYFMKKGELDTAIPWLELAKEAARYEPKHFPYLNLGRIYLSRCDFAGALKEFKKALELDPTNGELQLVVSRIQERFAY